jgi:rhodanese-related sulfurtransferase
MADSISVPDLSERLANNRNMTLLDVRRKNDFEQSPQKIAGACWRDPEAIVDWIDAVPKDQDVVVYCVKGGSVSQSVTAQLKQKACRVRFLEGGIKAWCEGGGEVAG